MIMRSRIYEVKHGMDRQQFEVMFYGEDEVWWSYMDVNIEPLVRPLYPPKAKLHIYYLGCNTEIKDV